MREAEILEEHVETEAEAALRAWFAEQEIKSPDTLDAAARLLTGLVTGLLGTLFGVLTLAEEASKQPAYMASGIVRMLGIISVLGLLGALGFSLSALMPGKLNIGAARLDEKKQAFQHLLEQKAGAVKIAAIAFLGGVTALAFVLIIALWKA